MRILVPYNVARDHVADGDLLSYRTTPWSLSGRAIAIAGRGEECHSGCAAWDDGRLQAFGMRLFGGKMRFLSAEVEANPGLIDVYRPVPIACEAGLDPTTGKPTSTSKPYNRARQRAIVDTMRDFCLTDRYGWLDVLLGSLAFLPFVRWFSHPHRNDLTLNKRAPFCSWAYAYALRTAYIDPVPNRADCEVLPADLASTPVLAYLFTLSAPVAEPLELPDYLQGDVHDDVRLAVIE